MLRRSDRGLLYTLMLGAVLPLLDATLLNMAIPAIGYSLGAPLSQIQWVITAYTLAAAISVPLSTWLCERVGAKTLWLAALSMFLAGACLCAIAWTVEMLVLCRAIQGVATGILLPTMQTIVVAALGQPKTREALSTISVPSVLVPILGPVLGGMGLLLFDWRIVFWAHVPIGLLALWFASRSIPDMRERQRKRFDAAGFVFLSLALVACIHSLSSRAAPSAAPVGVAGIVALLAFYLHALRRKEDAIVDVRLNRHAPFRRSCALLFLSGIAYYGGIFLVPLHVTQVGHHGMGIAGLLLALHGIGMLVGRQLLPRAAGQWGDRRVALGCVLLAVAGSAMLLPLFVNNMVLLAGGMVLRGAGIGVLTLLAMANAYTDLSPSQVAHASALTRMVTLLGAAIGTTLVATLCGAAGAQPPYAATGQASASLALTFVLLLCGTTCPARRSER